MSDSTPPPPLSYVEQVRKRPAMFIGGTDAYGLHHLVYFLLDGACPAALRGECGELRVELDADGGVSVFDSSPPLARGMLFQEFTASASRPASARTWGRLDYLSIVFSLASRFQLDQWEGGHHWRIEGARGLVSGGFREVLPAQPLPEGVSRGTRVSFLPDASIFEVRTFNAESLLNRCRELAFLLPELRVHFATPAPGGETLLRYPGGLAQRVAELTAGQTRLHPEPLGFELREGELRVRCALQWCDSGGVLLSFANTVHTFQGGVHERGLFRALRTVFPTATEQAPMPPGLTAIIAVDGPPERMAFEGPTKTLLRIPNLDKTVTERLVPVLEQAVRDHILVPLLPAPPPQRKPSRRKPR